VIIATFQTHIIKKPLETVHYNYFPFPGNCLSHWTRISSHTASHAG